MFKNDFNNDFTRGSIGERMMYDYLLSNGYTVDDWRDVDEARAKDIDFHVRRNSFDATLEVKTEFMSEKTGNLFIEYFNNGNRNCKGWFNYIEAQFIAFIQPSFRKCHIIPVSELVELVQKNNLREVGNRSENAAGWLLPLSVAMRAPHYKLIEL